MASARQTTDASASPTGAYARPEFAFLLPSLRGGGAERVVMDLARQAADEGHAVDMVVLNRAGAVVDDLGPGVRMVELGRSRAAFALPAMIGYLRHARPRAMLTTLEHTNVLAVIAARLVPGAGAAPRTRVVVREANTVSEDLVGLKGRAVRALMRVAYRSADAVVAVSLGVARSLEAELGLNPERVRVILNPVITPRVLAGAKEPVGHAWFAPGEPPVILGVGRLTEQKGFDTLVKAFATLRASRPCRLIILGEGELRPELEALARDLGIEADVDLAGFVGNPFPYMANCAVFVLSSRWEGLPNVLIQAMAVGAKVVASDCPSGPAEVTDGGTLAPLVPVDDVAALAAAMSATLEREASELPEGWRERYELEAITAAYLDVMRGG